MPSVCLFLFLITKTGELMQDQSLRSVAKTRDEGEEFLLEVISDDHKFNCLQSLSQCMDLVQWVRTVTMDTGKRYSLI